MVKRKANNIIVRDSIKKFKLELENLSVAESVKIKEADLKIELNQFSIFIVKNDSFFEIESNKEKENYNISIKVYRRYALRTRKLVEKGIVKKPAAKVQAKSEKQEKAVVKSQSKIKVYNEEFRVGEVVFAKCKGWCHWPAIITAISGIVVMAIHVQYFGTNQQGKINYKNKEEKTLIKFDQGNDIIEANQYKYRGSFAGALNAARIAIDGAKVDETDETNQ